MTAVLFPALGTYVPLKPGLVVTLLRWASICVACALPATAAVGDTVLANYLWHFPGGQYQSLWSRPTGATPLVRGRTASLQPIEVWPSDRFVDWYPYRDYVAVNGPASITLNSVPCRADTTSIYRDTQFGDTKREVSGWRAFTAGAMVWGVCYAQDIPVSGGTPPPMPPIRWTLEDKITFNAPVRRKALDGGEFDASPMVIERAGAPWITYYWGYKLGLVESQSDWNDANRSKMPADWPVFPTAEDNFKLTTLPPPWVEGEVTEYVNTADFPRQPDGQYFYAATDADRTALDGIATWRRTGNSFKQGGYVSVCRFYGGANGGPNTHFYSASDTECNWLKGVSFLAYEGQTFRVNKPLPLAANAPAGTQPSCPARSKPLYRLYNNASAPGKNYVSNHRYVTSRATVDAAVAIGWLDEGVSMCVPE